MTHLKNSIKKRLEKLGRSQGWLSRTSGLSTHHINKIVNGRITPNLETAFKISKALRCLVDDLWKL